MGEEVHMKYITVFLTSMLPISELRGAIPLGVLLGLPLWESFLLSVIGNIILSVFLMVLLRPIFHLLARIECLKRFMEYIQRRTIKKSQWVKKLSIFGLFLFVAIPLPGTGVYTATMVATFLDIRFRSAIPALSGGILTSGLLVSFLVWRHIL